MTALRMCELGQISRASLYRWASEAEHEDPDLDLRDQIQRIALEFPCYGRPRITAELKRRGWKVNHKRVGQILREDNLLCLRKRKFVVTTDSNHNFHVYPNLAGSLDLTGIDQLWIADITYIRLETEFIYLAVVLDAYSRAGDRLGARSQSGRRPGDCGVGDGVAAPAPGRRADASF